MTAAPPRGLKEPITNLAAVVNHLDSRSSHRHLPLKMETGLCVSAQASRRHPGIMIDNEAELPVTYT